MLRLWRLLLIFSFYTLHHFRLSPVDALVACSRHCLLWLFLHFCLMKRLNNHLVHLTYRFVLLFAESKIMKNLLRLVISLVVFSFVVLVVFCLNCLSSLLDLATMDLT